MTIHIMQITTKNGINFKIGVKGPKHYNKLKKTILNSKNEFVEIIPTLDIKKSEIVAIEYFDDAIVEEKEEENQ